MEIRRHDRVGVAHAVRRVAAHEAVKDNKGRVALERGPIVFCAEFADNKTGRCSTSFGQTARL